MTITYTDAHRAALADWLAKHDLARGLGDKESACTMGAIHIAITGRVSDEPLACMSDVLRKAVIGLQDAMPADMRNSARYKRLIQDMPGTGRDHGPRIG